MARKPVIVTTAPPEKSKRKKTENRGGYRGNSPTPPPLPVGPVPTVELSAEEIEAARMLESIGLDDAPTVPARVTVGTLNLSRAQLLQRMRYMAECIVEVGHLHRIREMMYAKFGSSRTETDWLYRRVWSEWQKNYEEESKNYKQRLIARTDDILTKLMNPQRQAVEWDGEGRPIRFAIEPRDPKLAAKYIDLLAKMTGSYAPVKVEAKVSVRAAVAHVVGGFSEEQVRELIAEGRALPLSSAAE